MVSETDLKKIVAQAKKDPVFFDKMFSDPEAALKHAGLSAGTTRGADECIGLTCTWTCSWTGDDNARAVRSVDCASATCSWTCNWTDFAERKQPVALRPVAKAMDCGGITCSWSCSWTGMQASGRAIGDAAKHALNAADCGGVTCAFTCSWTGFMNGSRDRGDPAVHR